MRIVLWFAVLVGAALSLYLSYQVANESIVIGSREGGAVYIYLQPVRFSTVAVCVAVFVGMLALMRATSALGQTRPWLWLAVWFVAAIVVEGLICWLAPFSLERIFRSDGANSFLSVAEHFTPATMLGDFERVRKYWAPHAQSNMPGKAILVYWLRQISRDPAVLPWLIFVVSNVGGLFLYGIARDFFDRRTAEYAFLLYVLAPGKMFFFPLLNTVTPAVVLLATWLCVRWVGRRNMVYAALFGSSLYWLILFEPAGLAAGGLLLGVVAWGVTRGMGRATLGWQGAVAVIAFAATYVGMRVWTGFDLLAAFRLLAADAVKFNVDAMRSYDVWVRQNLIDFVIALGVCQAVLVAAALVDGLLTRGSLRSRVTTPVVLATLSLVLMLGITDLLGVNRGEVIRLWIFMACLLQIPAAYVCARLNGAAAFAVVLAVTLIHVTIGVAKIGFILPG